MRTEKEMLNLIISTARADERIRAAFMQGSRANPEAPRDRFQDYDIVYVAGDTQPFIDDKKWIDRFGARLYMQYPEEWPYEKSDTANCYGWLMQFADSNRLDLHVCTPKAAQAEIQDGMFIVLLDKDGLLPENNVSSDSAYHVQPFTQAQFSATANEFWWCLNNVAKGLWRGELSYALEMLDFHVRPMLARMLTWRAGVDTDFSVSVGKSCKYIEKYLPDGMWRSYLATYARADEREIWECVFAMCALMNENARYVAQKTGFYYDETEAENALGYMKNVAGMEKSQ